MNARAKFLLECVSVAERIAQKQYFPAGPSGFGAAQYPERYVFVRSVEDVLSAAEQVRAWCEAPGGHKTPRNGRRQPAARKGR